VTPSQGVDGADVVLDPLDTAANPTPTPTLFISEEGVISGQVTSNGIPAAGIQVCAVAAFMSNTLCPTSGASGDYEIQGLRTGNCRVESDGAAVCYRNRVSFWVIWVGSGGNCLIFGPNRPIQGAALVGRCRACPFSDH